jgi:Asp-tRNA(Asn)/Glu-tRNA(Gln) amidotransferase A subunit family amidase
MTEIQDLHATGQAELIHNGQVKPAESCATPAGWSGRIRISPPVSGPPGPFTPPFNVTGQPAISLPLPWNSDGLPIGSQLVAPYGKEDLLIQVAAQLEQAQPWAPRKPPVSA